MPKNTYLKDACSFIHFSEMSHGFERNGLIFLKARCIHLSQLIAIQSNDPEDWLLSCWSPSAWKPYQTCRGKAGGVARVAIHLPTEHSPRQQWRFFYCFSRTGNTNGSHVWPMTHATRIALFLMGGGLLHYAPMTLTTSSVGCLAGCKTLGSQWWRWYGLPHS